MADTPERDLLPATGTGSVVLTLGGLAAAFGVASCCGLPFLLASAGLGTAWLTGVALLAAPHRSSLLIAGAVCLASGGILYWRQRRIATCSPGTFCSRPAGQEPHPCGIVARGRAALSRLHLRMTVQMITESTITCPSCGASKVETMPTDACQFFTDAPRAEHFSGRSEAIAACSVPTVPRRVPRFKRRTVNPCAVKARKFSQRLRLALDEKSLNPFSPRRLS